MRTLLFLHGLTIDGRDAEPLARALPAWNVVALPLPGHEVPLGDDPRPRALAEGLSVPEGRFTIVGHSWGAALALWLATLHGERVEALVLLEGGWFDRRALPERPAPRDEQHAAALRALFDSPSSEAWPALGAHRTRTLAVAGMATEGMTKQRELERFAAKVPEARLWVFPALGHDLLREEPEGVAAAVAGWIEGRPLEALAELPTIQTS